MAPGAGSGASQWTSGTSAGLACQAGSLGLRARMREASSGGWIRKE